jgi:iron complex transport system substrate-binding protein
LYFRGGKGVSTTLGALVALNPPIGGASILVYLGALAALRVSALGSLFAMLTAFGATLIFDPLVANKIGVGIMVAIVLVRHRENWNKLLAMALFVALLAVPASAETRKPITDDRKPAPLPSTDFRGRVLSTASPPQRIAALMPALAEMVVDLGAGARLIAAPEYATLPKAVDEAVTRVGPYNRISAEAVYALKPDLVLASMDGNEASVVEQLEKLGARVVTVNTLSLAEILRSAEIVATAVGEPRHRSLSKLREAFTHPRRKAQAPRVFVQVGWEPLVTVSRKTFVGELVELAGGENVFADAPSGYPRPNPEEVLARDPDVLIICKKTTDDEAERARKFWVRFGRMKAVKNGRVVIVKGDWITKPGLGLLHGLRELKRLL